MRQRRISSVGHVLSELLQQGLNQLRLPLAQRHEINRPIRCLGFHLPHVFGGPYRIHAQLDEASARTEHLQAAISQRPGQGIEHHVHPPPCGDGHGLVSKVGGAGMHQMRDAL